MARAFASASSQYLERTSAVVTAMPLTMACWFSADRSADYELMCLGVSGASTNEYRLELRPNQPSAGSYSVYAACLGGGNQRQGIKGAYPASTWTHAAGVFTAVSDVNAYLNGVVGSQSNSGADPTAPTGLNRTSIGRIPRATPIFYLNGSLAEAAIWNVALTAAEVAVLATGASPLLVRPASLVSYWPLVGRYSPEIDLRGGSDLTVTGATAADHPRVLYPRRRASVFVPAAAGGGNRRRRVLLTARG